MGQILHFFLDRCIAVDSIHMQTVLASDARLTILCLIEKDQIRPTRYSLEKIQGILELELLESKMATLVKQP